VYLPWGGDLEHRACGRLFVIVAARQSRSAPGILPGPGWPPLSLALSAPFFVQN